MPSYPLDGKHGRTTSGVTCHHRIWTAHTVKHRRAWHAIIAFRQPKRSNDVERGMPSYPLDGKHGRTTSGMTCHHHLWTAHTVEQRRAWHAIIAFGQHTRSNDVRHGMPSYPLDSKHGRTTLGVTCHHRLWTAHTVECHQVWHAIIAFGQHTRSNDVGCGMTSPPLDSTHGRMTSGVAYHHRPWAAHTIKLRRAWHDITAFG